nr:hypothetical protein [Aeromicrobium sp.]
MPRRSLILSVIAMLVVALPSAAGAASQPSGRVAPASVPGGKPLMVVVGDSMSALASTPREAGGFVYTDDPNQHPQAWWSILRHDTGYRAQVFAEGGSGWNKPGRGCSLTTFADRVQQPNVRAQLAAAKVVIVLGGVNDADVCTSNRTLEEAMDLTVSTIREVAPTARLVVGSPYPTAPVDATRQIGVIDILKRVAALHGVTYVDLPLTRQQTRDGVHPNRAGAHLLAERVRVAVGLHKTAAAIKKEAAELKAAKKKAAADKAAAKKKAAAAKKAAAKKAAAKKAAAKKKAAAAKKKRSAAAGR